jgi:4-amino-4-deoxy-L-arabinose transferase-like glycosyltransferase
MINKQLKSSLIIALISALFYIPFLGGVHLFDWDEVNFAEITREMMMNEQYFRVYINFMPFWEKPPFFFWMQLLAMKAFGVGEFAARLPNALYGVATLVLLYNIGCKLYNHRFGLIWTLTYFGSVLPFLYFKSGIIDPVFNFFIFLGLYLFILFYWKKDRVEHIE